MEWINDELLFSLNLWEGDKIFMDWINNNKFFSAKFIYENKKLASHSVYFYSNFLAWIVRRLKIPVITVSEASKEVLEKQTPLKNMKVIYNGIANLENNIEQSMVYDIN